MPAFTRLIFGFPGKFNMLIIKIKISIINKLFFLNTNYHFREKEEAQNKHNIPLNIIEFIYKNQSTQPWRQT